MNNDVYHCKIGLQLNIRSQKKMTAIVNLVLPFSCVFIQINQVGHIKSLCDLTALVWRAVEITHESSQLVTLGGLRVHLHQVSVTIGATITRKQREHNYP